MAARRAMQEACSERPGEGLSSRKSENASFVFLLAGFFSSARMDTKRSIPVFKHMKTVSHRRSQRSQRNHYVLRRSLYTLWLFVHLKPAVLHEFLIRYARATHAHCVDIRRPHHATSDCR